MTKVVIDKEAEIAKLKSMLPNLTDDKDKQSVRFAINVISGFKESGNVDNYEALWIKCSDRLPDHDGEYLITKLILGEPKTSTCSFSKDLYGVNDYAFYNYRYKRKTNRAGWYGYDSEYGFYKIGGVIAWQELPEPYKEEE